MAKHFTAFTVAVVLLSMQSAITTVVARERLWKPNAGQGIYMALRVSYAGYEDLTLDFSSDSGEP